MAVKRIEWLDIAKGIAIVSVVAGHTLAVSGLARHIIFTFHMPLFFVAAGYTFKSGTMRSVCRRSVKRLLIPYLMLSVIQWGGVLLRGELSIISVDWIRQICIIVMASGAKTKSSIPAVGIPWFLAALFSARILYNMIVLVAEKYGKSNRFSGTLCITCGIIGIVFGASGLYLPMSLDVAFIAVLFMWVGSILKCNKHANALMLSNGPVFADFVALAIWVAAIMFSRLEMAMRIYSPAVLAIVGAIAGTYCVFRLSYCLERFKPLKTLFGWCGRNSLLLLSVHTLESAVNWRRAALFDDIPVRGLITSIARILFDVCGVKLIGLIGYSGAEASRGSIPKQVMESNTDAISDAY